jgi:hypothetical protein
MKCPVCHSDKIQFLGIWYTSIGDYYILQSQYGCQRCRVLHTRPVSENDYYYLKEDGSIIMRPTHIPLKNERRIYIIDYDPGMVVRDMK